MILVGTGVGWVGEDEEIVGLLGKGLGVAGRDNCGRKISLDGIGYRRGEGCL